MRSNLDPFDQHDDAAVSAAIENVMKGYSTAADAGGGARPEGSPAEAGQGGQGD